MSNATKKSVLKVVAAIGKKSAETCYTVISF